MTLLGNVFVNNECTNTGGGGYAYALGEGTILVANNVAVGNVALGADIHSGNHDPYIVNNNNYGEYFTEPRDSPPAFRRNAKPCNDRWPLPRLAKIEHPVDAHAACDVLHPADEALAACNRHGPVDRSIAVRVDLDRYHRAQLDLGRHLDANTRRAASRDLREQHPRPDQLDAIVMIVPGRHLPNLPLFEIPGAELLPAPELKARVVNQVGIACRRAHEADHQQEE